MDTPKTHCQICAREIKDKTGVIAHHGYTRPGGGWQTRSCYGARFAPYEESRDRIPDVYPVIQSAIDDRVALIERLKGGQPVPNPEHKHWMEQKIMRRYWSKPETPEPQPATIGPGERGTGSYRSWTYESIRERMVAEAENDIKHCEAVLAALHERYDKWTPPPG